MDNAPNIVLDILKKSIQAITLNFYQLCFAFSYNLTCKNTSTTAKLYQLTLHIVDKHQVILTALEQSFAISLFVRYNILNKHNFVLRFRIT